MTTTLSVRLPDELSRQLTLLAEASKRTKSFCAIEAITDYVKNESWQLQAIEESLEDLREEFLTDYVFPTMQAGAIYERNAINAAFPILTYDSFDAIDLEDGDVLKINFETSEATNISKGKSMTINPFSEVQLEIYQNGGLF